MTEKYNLQVIRSQFMSLCYIKQRNLYCATVPAQCRWKSPIFNDKYTNTQMRDNHDVERQATIHEGTVFWWVTNTEIPLCVSNCNLLKCFKRNS